MRFSVLAIWMAATPLFAASTVVVKTGGMLITNDRGTYYLETRQWTEIRFKNPLLIAGARVDLEVFEGENPAFLRYPMKTDGDAWVADFAQLRHGLGSNTKIGGVKFMFRVSQPGGATVVLGCDDAEDSFYSADFGRLSDLPWKKSAGQTAVLSEVKTECAKKRDPA